jgi:hypothetical protein
MKFKCEDIPHTVRLTAREQNIVNALMKSEGQTFSEIVRNAIVKYGIRKRVRTDKDGNVM